MSHPSSLSHINRHLSGTSIDFENPEDVLDLKSTAEEDLCTKLSFTCVRMKDAREDWVHLAEDEEVLDTPEVLEEIIAHFEHEPQESEPESEPETTHIGTESPGVSTSSQEDPLLTTPELNAIMPPSRVSEREAREPHSCIWWIPSTSKWAKAVDILSVLVIFVSVVGFCLETLPGHKLEDFQSETEHPLFFSMEASCIAYFTIEFLMRMYSTKENRLRWLFLHPMNLIDLISVIPFFVDLFVSGTSRADELIRLLRLLRVARLLKLMRHSAGVRIFLICLIETFKDLLFYFVIMLVGMVLFSSAIYYFEKDHNTSFQSIPDTFWFSIVTMTTVGYGTRR